MSQIAIDPIGYSDALQKAGMPKEQADLIARTQESTVERIIEARELATKKDLELALLRLRVDLIRWLVGSNIALGAFLVAVIAWLK